MSDTKISSRIKAALILLRSQHPFFGTLALYCNVRVVSTIDSAATDGENLFLNPDFISKLNKNELLGVLVHEILHMALLHNQRRSTRDPILWNIAADIVVNGMILDLTNYKLPNGAIHCKNLSQLSVEEVYEKLPTRNEISTDDLKLVDLIPQSVPSSKDLATYWKTAVSQAQSISIQNDIFTGQGSMDKFRDFDAMISPFLSWQELLWGFLIATPYDFHGFDRRFIFDGLYLDALEEEYLSVAIAIDTSGSISISELSLFIAEVKSIIGIYPHIKAELFYCDADIFGPYELNMLNTLPPPQGGGGTSFEPFFQEIKQQYIDLAIYFTDGYGSFPKCYPEHETLWVITSSGIENNKIPFGSIARMSIN